MIEPVVEATGLELVDVSLVRGRQPWSLRVTIDTLAGDGRVPIDACASVSRELSVHLDAADSIPVSYRLEVSSPGLDRVLAREKDFSAARGGEVAIETRLPLEGRRRFRGTLVSFDAGIACVRVDGREFRVPFDAVSRAHAIYRFTRADFAKSAGARPVAGSSPGGPRGSAS